MKKPSFSYTALRYSLLNWINQKIFKTPEAQIPPRPIQILHFILFPLHGIYARQSQVKYDFICDKYIIRDVEIPGRFFDLLRKNIEQNHIEITEELIREINYILNN